MGISADYSREVRSNLRYRAALAIRPDYPEVHLCIANMLGLR